MAGQTPRRLKRVLVLCPYPLGTAPGQRFGFEQYLDILREAGIEAAVEPFLTRPAWDILYKPGHLIGKTMGVLGGFLRRLLLLPRVFGYDFIYIFREASPLGPPVFEWTLFLLGRKVVFFFDDAIFIPKASKANWFVSRLKWTSKIAFIVSRCHKVAGANKFLVDWASRLNPRVVLIPSTIDPAYHKPPQRPSAPGRRPVVGWTGTHSTAPYLDLLRPVLKSLQETHEFEFRVICDVDPCFPELPRYRFVEWRAETEIEDLGDFDIGVMPLPEGEWEKGKVGFKAVQYSAMGIPSVVSSAGSGREVVIDGKTGFVVDNTDAQWRAALADLLSDPKKAKAFGSAAREHIVAHYSVPSQARAFVGLFE